MGEDFRKGFFRREGGQRVLESLERGCEVVVKALQKHCQKSYKHVQNLFETFKINSTQSSKPSSKPTQHSLTVRSNAPSKPPPKTPSKPLSIPFNPALVFTVLQVAPRCFHTGVWVTSSGPAPTKENSSKQPMCQRIRAYPET